MAADFTYNRSKIAIVNSTDINVTYEQRESDASRAAIESGSTGIAELTMMADADESGGTDVQDIFKILATPILISSTGKFSVEITITPILGDGSDGDGQIATFEHDEDMDEWQAAAGRARQA